MKSLAQPKSAPKQTFGRGKFVISLVLFFSVVNTGFCDDQLQRLFFLPKERDKLDTKVKELLEQKTMPKAANSPKSDLPNVTLSIDGLVLPKYGAPSIWVNGINQDELNEADKPITLRAHPKQRGELILPNRERIKVGDTIESLSGEKTELLRDSPLRIQRRLKNDAASNAPR